MNTLVHERQLGWLDHVRLFNLVSAPRAAARVSEALADHARDMLDLAEVVDPKTLPADVVTMRSRVVLSRGGELLDLTLCYPDDQPDGIERVSVFSPLGMAMLGARVGDSIGWRGPAGEEHTARIEALPYQPEAAGDFSR